MTEFVNDTVDDDGKKEGGGSTKRDVDTGNHNSEDGTRIDGGKELKISVVKEQRDDCEHHHDPYNRSCIVPDLCPLLVAVVDEDETCLETGFEST